MIFDLDFHLILDLLNVSVSHNSTLSAVDHPKYAFNSLIIAVHHLADCLLTASKVIILYFLKVFDSKFSHHPPKYVY